MHSYEIHFYNVHKELFADIELAFEDFNWSSGFAAYDWQSTKTKDSIFFEFKSIKPFVLDVKRVHPKNLLNVLIGKEQFFSRIYHASIYSDFDITYQDMDVFFVSDKGRIHTVLLDKYCEMYL